MRKIDNKSTFETSVNNALIREFIITNITKINNNSNDNGI